MDAPPPQLVDSHCHLDAAEFAPDRSDVIARARRAGVVAQIIPAVRQADWPALAQLCAGTPGLYPAYGLHPMYLAEHRPVHLDDLAQQLRGGDAVAVGECGLDFYLPELDPAAQRAYFNGQLTLARETALPVIVHARRAVEEVIATLRRVGPPGGVVHSYSGSFEQAAQLFKLGFLLGFGGPITYPRAVRLRDIVARMPLEYLLLESDAPDQPLAEYRGQRNEPARVSQILDCVAGLRSESRQAIASATRANAERLFGIRCAESGPTPAASPPAAASSTAPAAGSAAPSQSHPQTE